MGLSNKQVSGDGVDWGESFLRSGGLELPKPNPARRQTQPQSEPLACPRCGSTNTKFCYYNNYNKTQPRHFCKACKRHWTKGGTLRNVPVGGGRKKKRLKTSSASATTSSAAASNLGNHLQVQQQYRQSLQDDSIGSTGNFSMKIFSGNNENFLGSSLQTPPFIFSSNLSSFENSVNPSSIINIPTSFQSSDAYNFTIAAQPSVDMASYWNQWEDIDTLVSTDQLNMPWDDTEVKPQ